MVLTAVVQYPAAQYAVQVSEWLLPVQVGTVYPVTAAAEYTGHGHGSHPNQPPVHDPKEHVHVPLQPQ